MSATRNHLEWLAERVRKAAAGKVGGYGRALWPDGLVVHVARINEGVRLEWRRPGDGAYDGAPARLITVHLADVDWFCENVEAVL